MSVMSDDYNDSEILDFSQTLFEEYEKKTLMPELANIEDYESQNLEFDQIAGRYSSFDTGWIIGRKGSTKYATNDAIIDVIRSLALGERNYLIKKLAEFSEKGDLHTENMPEFNLDRLRGLVSSFNEITDVFIPREEGSDVIEYSVRNPEIKDGELGGISYYKFPEFNLWVLGDSVEIEDIVVLNRNNISVVQKRKKDMRELDKPDLTLDDIDELDVSKELGTNEKLMLYYGESDEKESIDFLFRTVMAVKEPAEKDAGVVYY